MLGELLPFVVFWTSLIAFLGAISHTVWFVRRMLDRSL